MGKKWSSLKVFGFLIVALIIIIVKYNNAYAQLSVALPVYGEIVGGKDSPFKSDAITKLEPSYADPFNHRNFQEQPTVGGMVYYLPPGVMTHEQRIHSNYTANTDACAACHFTHTALGPSLLQWPSIYDACISCHDGTLGDYTYDVLSGLIRQGGPGERIRTYGGLFGDNMKVANINDAVYNPDTLSNHMPDGSLTLGAAWGGDENSTEIFTCVSCHTPHGQGGNARILNPDPNKIRFKNAKDNPNEFVRWLDRVAENVYQAPEINWIQGYPYTNLTKIIISKDDPLVELDNGVLKIISGETDFLNPEDYEINYREGKVTLSANAMVLKQDREVHAIYVPGIYVAMEINNYMTANETVTYLAKDKNGRPTSLNSFCGICHLDYNTEHFQEAIINPRTGITEPHASAGNATGTYTQAYRHQVGNRWVDEDWGRDETPSVIKFAYDEDTRIITCLTCHLAHGVDKEYWNDTKGDYDFPEDQVDVNPSSTLKRLPNMAVCEACHQMKYAKEGRTGPS